MGKGEADALRGEVTEIIKTAAPPKDNISKEERDALETLGKDKEITVIRADKGKCMVVMDREEYIRKMETKLSDTHTRMNP